MSRPRYGNIDVDAGAMTVLTITAGSESDVVLTSSGSITEDEMPSTDVTAYQLTAMAAGHVYASHVGGPCRHFDHGDQRHFGSMIPMRSRLPMLRAGDGSVTITTEGTLTATSVISTTDTDSNDITLTAIGDIEVGLIDAGFTGDVLINASGAITADDTDAVEVTADPADGHSRWFDHFGHDDCQCRPDHHCQRCDRNR